MTKKAFQAEIKKITAQIIKNYRPEKIILFGSLARGNFSEDSDVDLFIIKKTESPPQKRIEEILDFLYPDKWYLSDEGPPPLDVIVYSPKELRRELVLGDFFIEEILTKGKVLYEKA